jgi:hypothetical protein
MAMLNNIAAILLLTSPIWGIWVGWKVLCFFGAFVDDAFDRYDAKRTRKALIKDGVDPEDLEIIGNMLHIKGNFRENMKGNNYKKHTKGFWL